jgi:Sigma-70 region 2
MELSSLMTIVDPNAMTAMWERDRRINKTKQLIARQSLKFTNQPSAAAQSIARNSGSEFACKRHRQLRLELYSAAALGTAPPSSALVRRERDRGEPLMLNVSVRPQPAAVAAVSALAATAEKTSSDEILVEQIVAGSKPAMQALFARHRTYVYRWLLRFVSNETLAEDLLSEVFLDVWRQAGRFQRRSPSRPGYWRLPAIRRCRPGGGDRSLRIGRKNRGHHRGSGE